MERIPPAQFERTGTNEAGYPILERVRRTHEQIGSPEFHALDRKSRGRLGLALAFVGAIGAGVGVKYSSDRFFQREGGTERVASESSGEIATPDYTHVEPVIPDTEQTESRPEPSPESITEAVPEIGQYDRLVQRYETRFHTPYHSIVFIDEYGNSVGEPMRYQKYVGPLPEGREPVPGQAPEHRYVPSAEFDTEIGFPTDGVSQEWVDYMLNHQLTPELQERVTSVLNVNPEFTAVFADESLAELREKILAGEVSTYEDVLAYFIEQPFAGSGGLNRYEYALEHVSYRSEDLVIPIEGGETIRRAVPPAVQTVFTRMLPGLIANESGYRNLTSDADAQGPLQIRPDEWRRVTGEDTVDTEYARQVAVWGEIISDFYDSVQDRIGEERLALLRSRFDTEEEFQTTFIARITLNAYNVGPRRMAEVVRTYVDSVQITDMPSGVELFQAVTEFGRMAQDDTHGGTLLDGYDAYGSTYVQKSEAAAQVLNARFGRLGERDT